MMITYELIQKLRSQFALDWQGIHGVSHWARVRENGQARTGVIELFVFLHDSMRVNDYSDPKHGRRAAHYAESLRGKLFDLDDDLRLLNLACENHSDGLMVADITVQVCWDADRLDLGRVGDPYRLCSEVAKSTEMIEWAYARSVKSYLD